MTTKKRSYSLCISTVNELLVLEEKKDIRIYEYLSRLALEEFELLISELKNKEDVLYQAILTFSEYMSSGDPEKKEECVKKFSNWLVDSNVNKDPHFLILASKLFMQDGNVNKAIQTVHKATDLEMFSVLINMYLLIDRVDLAVKELKKMKGEDELSSLTILTEILINVHVGGYEKLKDSISSAEHLIEKFGENHVLLNVLAVTNMMLGEYEKAERLLFKSLGKKSNHAETLVNLVICQKNLKKEKGSVEKYMNMLKNTDNVKNGSCKWYNERIEKEKLFDSLIKK